MSAHLRGVVAHWSPTRVVGVSLPSSMARPRRLRKPRSLWVLKYNGPGRLTAEQAAMVRARWLAAQRTGVAVVSNDWDVQRVSRG